MQQAVVREEFDEIDPNKAENISASKNKTKQKKRCMETIKRAKREVKEMGKRQRAKDE